MSPDPIPHWLNARVSNIVKKAARIGERLDVLRQSGASDKGEVEADVTELSWMQKWRHYATADDARAFDRRLSRLSCEATQVARILDDSALQFDGSYPDWACDLSAILDSAQAASARDQLVPVTAGRDLPVFSEAFSPFAVWAQTELELACPASGAYLSESARIDLTCSLFELLSWICAKTFALKLNIARILGGLKGDSPKARYQYFVAQVLCNPESLGQIFEEYPVLARLMATVTRSWLEAQAEFLSRLARDEKTISVRLLGGTPLGQVVRIQSALSDFHAGARAVCALEFTSGLRLIYKPRPIQAEAHFQRLLSWCNDTGVQLPFKTFTSIVKRTYGWVEAVNSPACKSLDEVKRFYLRQGMILCLTHVLGATDLHCENVIAAGEYPLWIDLETLFHPRLKPAEDELDSEILIANSVLRTGMLPGYLFGDVGAAGIDNSALGARPQQTMPVRRRAWVEPNTDEMRLAFKYLRLDDNAPYLPHHEGKPFFAEQFTDEVVAGFQQMYTFLYQNRQRLTAPGGPLSKFERCPVRFVSRPTDAYFELLNLSLDPRWLRNGVEREIVLESLWRNRIGSGGEALVQSEINDLWRADIPIFRAFAGKVDLQDSEACHFRDILKERGFQAAIDRIRSLNHNDCEIQIKQIRTALVIKQGEQVNQSNLAGFLAKPRPITNADLLAAAVDLGHQLAKDGIQSGNGIGWIGIEFNLGARQYALTPLGSDLYNGNWGIALFLGSLYALTGDGQFRQVAYQALNPGLISWAQPSRARRLLRSGLLSIGGFTGVGGAVYVLSKLSAALNDGHLLASALDLALLLDPAIVGADNAYDVVSGSAGCLLALLELFRQTPNKEILNRAILCGEHLVRQQVAGEIGSAWPNLGATRPLTGFAHGTAGIAYALAELANLTGGGSFQRAAEEALIYERNTFLPAEQNWPDFRKSESSLVARVNDSSASMVAWCHGATGIGYSRLEMLTLMGDADIAQEIDIAQATTLSALGLDRDHLCCGLAGQIDFLLQTGSDLGRDILVTAARNIAAASLARMQERGHWALGPAPNMDLPVPGLMQGLAGIGMTLLRLVAPQDVCRVLVLK